MRVFIDADACPVVSIVENISKKYNIPVTLLCDTNHVLTSEYSEVIVVGAGADAVDYKLISICCYPASLVLQIILISVKLNEGTDSDILMFFTAECLNRYLLVLSYQSYKNSRYLPDQSLTPAIITIQCTTTSLDREMLHQRYDNNYNTF